MGGQPDSSESSQTMSAQLLAAPAGVFLLVLVSAGLVRYGLFCVARARYAKM